MFLCHISVHYVFFLCVFLYVSLGVSFFKIFFIGHCKGLKFVFILFLGMLLICTDDTLVPETIRCAVLFPKISVITLIMTCDCCCFF